MHSCLDGFAALQFKPRNKENIKGQQAPIQTQEQDYKEVIDHTINI